MARMPRLVVPGYAHHVTQRGNRRQRTFWRNQDYRSYIQFLADAAKEAEAAVWAYCLMPNHVHVIIVPNLRNSLAAAFRIAHRRYTCHINLRQKWVGHLWQGRFHSTVMDESHLLTAVRYVLMNPVRAALCGSPFDWPWSSASAHLHGVDDALVTVGPMSHRVSNWSEYLRSAPADDDYDDIRRNSRTGRPLGDAAFVEKLELETGRRLKPRRPGRPAAGRGDGLPNISNS